MRRILSFLLVFLFAAPMFSHGQPLVSGDAESDGYDLDLSESFPADAAKTTHQFPARGNSSSVDWGLALSGGGIRSGYFNIGVLKALYDKDYLDNIDVISTVSGGGYASYWLYTNYKHSGTAANFGEAAFSDARFIQNICDLQEARKARFVPTASLLKIIFSSKGRAFSRYKTAIENTFGNEESPKTRLDFLNDEIKDRKAPYFIINTTLRAKGDARKNPSRRLFEITPDYRGNLDMNFTDWTDDDRISLSESIAASAAPKWKIAHPINSFDRKNKLYLSDGGHSENLAALALIRRGVKNIIIVDAEEDATYEFEGYTILQKLLKDKNIKISLQVGDIDDFLEKYKSCKKKNENCKRKNKSYDEKKVYQPSVTEGTATSIPDKTGEAVVSSRIYYIKMTLPKSVFPHGVVDRKEKKSEAYKRGEADYNSQPKKGKNYDCKIARFDAVKNQGLYTDLYSYRVRTYAEAINNPKFYKTPYLWSKMKFFDILSKISPFLTYKFPHITTIDQSFFSDQAEAFVGLGYLEASEMREIQKIETAIK